MFPGKSTIGTVRLGGLAIIGIPGEMAAELYGLKIVSKKIEDLADNTTRFMVIGDLEVAPSGKDKTTLLVSTSDTAGGAGVLHGDEGID